VRGEERAAATVPEQLRGRRLVLTVSLAVAALAVVGRAVQLQALEGEAWQAIALRQHEARAAVPAQRGNILDRHGRTLAMSRESFRVGVAPRELRDPAAVQVQLASALSLSEPAATRLVDRDRPWVTVPGRFSARHRRALETVQGVYFEPTFERFLPHGEIAREIIGFTTAEGDALGGVEQQLDHLLRGVEGESLLRRREGRRRSLVSLSLAPPRAGADVVLTIDAGLQELAHGALREAIRSAGATGGDLLITDPHTGEILAAASLRQGGGRHLGAATDPFEPGSTLKPFLVAALLEEERVALSDSVDGEQGLWRDERGRVIRDVSRRGKMTFAESIEVSSNIALVKLMPRLSAEEQYAYLRAFGFGTATGVAYPSEAPGRLANPSRWSAYTSASLAMGYEILVTPLQLAMAYGALANGGVMMEPRLVREVRDAAGRPVFSNEPRPVRRVVRPETAAEISAVLASAVEEGTATQAALRTFAVAGKTGTARRTTAGGGYAQGSYTATFAGYFPADDPQLTILVKVDEPQGAYFGGAVAAPVSQATLQAILAAREPAVDRGRLLATRPAAGPPVHALATQEESTPPRRGSVVFDLREGPPRVFAGEEGSVVPDLSGTTVRDAAHALHRAGWHVRLQGGGVAAGTDPAPGTRVMRGDTILLRGDAS
jgi:cell division protein FtsI (penicillin-binding protein 3)